LKNHIEFFFFFFKQWASRSSASRPLAILEHLLEQLRSAIQGLVCWCYRTFQLAFLER